MYCIVEGNLGNEVPRSSFGFVVNDEMAAGTFGGDYGDVPELQDALDAISNALGGNDWQHIPCCYNNYANPNYPLGYEFLYQIAAERLNAVPLYHAHDTDGSETISALINGKQFTNIINGWKDSGECYIGRNTPVYSHVLFDYATNTVGIRFYFTALSSSCINNGKFDFDSNDIYGTYSISLQNNRNALINKWSWHVGQYTSGDLPIPQSWYELNGTSVTTGEEDTDPFEPDGNSGTGGGNGEFSGTGDDIDIPALPTLSAVDTGFITLFNPSVSQLVSLSNYMWGSLFDISTYKKIFADPMDCILGLSIVPVSVPNGVAKNVTVGNISTDVSMTTAASQYVEVNCGSLDVREYWGAYLDYEPYTKAEIYLPYIGTHPISVDDIMKKTVTVKYHVDILSGACTAYVKCGGSVLYTFIGQCSSSIPITGNDWTNVINGVISIAGSIGSMVSTGGASAPTAIPGIASAAINSLKPSIEKSGSMSGTGGMLGVQTPYLILTRPRQALPANQNKYMGYPSFITASLGSVQGYTEIESIHLENISATDAELDEIETLLKGGVIL